MPAANFDRSTPARRHLPAAHRKPRPALRLATIALALVAATLAGCRMYLVGNCSLYPPDIRTVYVPVFDSMDYRRYMGERLTEAVVKQIELKTPFKVVNTPDADSILTGKLMVDQKGVLVKPPTDEQRLIQNTLVVQVSWVDRRGNQVRPDATVPLPDSVVNITQVTNLVPEVGQTIATQQQIAIQRIAEQIVSMVEAP